MLPATQLHALLKAKGITHLHHVNTMQTSLTFISQRSLVSRGYVESAGLLQTDQLSDLKDKEDEVWNDVFLDGLDLHKYFIRPNRYGPVLFKMKLDILLSPFFPLIHVTTNNPWYWKINEKKYYDDINKLELDYLTGNKLRDSQIMFTIKNPGIHVALNKFCEEIWVDNPNIFFANTDGRIVDSAVNKLKEALKSNGLSQIPINIRHDGITSFPCRCFGRYNWMFRFDNSEFKKLYATKNLTTP